MFHIACGGAKIICKCRHRFFKRNAVLAEISCRLVQIPFKFHSNIMPDGSVVFIGAATF